MQWLRGPRISLPTARQAPSIASARLHGSPDRHHLLTSLYVTRIWIAKLLPFPPIHLSGEIPANHHWEQKDIHTHTPKKEEKTQQFRNLWGSELELPMRQPHSNMGAIQCTELFQYNVLNNFKALQNSFLLLWSIFWPNLIVHSCFKTDLTYLKACVDRFKMVSLPCPFQTRWSVQGSMESSPALQRANALGGPGEQHPPPWPYLTPSPRAKRDRDSR